MPKLIKMMTEVRWRYERPVTTMSVQAASVISTLLARALLPRSWRPSKMLDIAGASTGAYIAVRLGSHSGWTKRFKHSILDRIGGEVDDAQTWMLGIAAGGASLVLARFVRRALVPSGTVRV